MKFEAFVFDFDGTIGTSGISREVLKSWCDQLNLDCEYYEIIEYLQTLPGDIQIEKTNDLIKLEQEQMAQTDFFPGAMEWFEYIKKHNLKSAIYSRNTRTNIEIIMKAKNVKVDMIMGRDCSIPKPHPEGLEIIVEKLNLNKSKTLMVGDSLISDVEVGQKVGVKTALVNFEGGALFEKIRPDFVWKNLLEGFNEVCI